jgi:hypothetical protein
MTLTAGQRITAKNDAPPIIVNQPAPSNSILTVPDSEASKYPIGGSLLFSDGKIGTITNLIFESFTSYIENFFTGASQEGLQVVFSLATPTPTTTQSSSQSVTQSSSQNVTQSSSYNVINNPTPTPTSTRNVSNQITCAPVTTSNPANNMGENVTTTLVPQGKSTGSVLYVSDCVGYPIGDVLFKNDTLIIELDTSDDTLLYSGYYKLVI